VTLGSLPTGLSLSPGGDITGTPTGTSQSFTVQVTSGAQTATRALTINVVPQLSISTTSLPGGIQGQSYGSQALVASGGTGSYGWSIVSGSLPAGLDLSAGGSITGTPTGSGTANFTVQVASGTQTAQQALSITVIAALTVTTSALPNGVQGVSYGTQSLTAVGGTGGYAWSVISGALPAGLDLSTAGDITGTPTGSGTANFTVQVTSGAQVATKALSITVVPQLSISTSSLPGGTQGQSYGTQSLVASGGTGSYAWSVVSGSLPAGLSLSSGGDITGTPTGSGTANFTVQVTSGAQVATKALSITIIPALQITTTSLPAGTAGDPYSQSLTATGGVGGYTWLVLSGSLPSGLDLSSGGDITGTPTGSGTANFTVQVTSGSQTAQRSLSITVMGLPQNLQIVTAPSTSAQSGVAFLQQPVVDVRDGANNLLAGFDVTATIESGGGTLGGTTTVTTNGSGRATFTDLRLEGVVGERTLRFTSGSASIVSGSIFLTPGAPATVSINTQPPPSQISGEPFSPGPSVQVRDSWNNLVTGVGVTAAIASGGGSVSGANATTNGSGVATFPSLVVDGGPGPRTLNFTSGIANATSSSVHLTYSVGFHPDLASFCADQLMDVSIPGASFPRPAPLVGFVHGGGWTSGDQKLGLLLDEVRNEMLSRGYIVVSMTYRKAEEFGNRWPVQIQDVKCVIRHMRALAADYGVDVDRVGVWGSSAGGHLASMLGVTDADDAGGSLEGPGFEGWSSRLRAAVAIGGISDVTPPAQSELHFFGPEWTFDTWPGPSQELIDASPVTWATSDDPPFLVIHGTADTTVEINQAYRLQTALTNAGASVQLVEVVNGGHNLNDVGMGTPSLSLAQLAQIVADFFDATVKP